MSSNSDSPPPTAACLSVNAAVNGFSAHTVPSSSSTACHAQQPVPSGIPTSPWAGAGAPQQSVSVFSLFIPGDPLNTVQYITDPAWPADLRLDCSLCNWEEWSRRLKLICRGQGFTEWLDVTFMPPDAALYPRAHRIWTLNDHSLKSFILCHISQQDYEAVRDLPDSRTVFAELRRRYEKLGRHMQILLLVKAMKVQFRPGVPLSQTLGEIETIFEKIEAIGPPDYDQLKVAVAIHALGDHYPNLQSAILSITKQENFSIDDVARRIFEEDDPIRNREYHGLLPPSTSLVRQARGRTRPTCPHYKPVGHFVDFCTQPGGKMEGRSPKDAKAAQAARRASQELQRTGTASQPQSASANAVLTDTNLSSAVFSSKPLTVINGVPCILVPTPTAV